MKNKTNIINILSCSLVLVLLATMFFIVPDKELSQKENRSLTLAPKFNIAQLFSGEYTAHLADYISDQFPLRDTFVSVKAYSELLVGKLENNGVVYGKGGVLIARDNMTENRLKENIQAVSDFATATQVPVCLGILPRTIDVFSEYLPQSYPIDNNSSLWKQYFECLKKSELIVPNLYEPLCEQNNYYLTDHHYNTYGAYQTYNLLGDSLGYTPKDIKFFKKEKVAEDFCGTSMRASGFYLAPKDEITLFRYDGDTEYKVMADGKQIDLYDFSKLDTTDKYAVFLGGNHARVDINSGKNKPKLLVIRDSFADSLVPFLAIHYDLTLIDLRYFTDNVAQIVKKEGIDKVLVLESIGEFANTKNLSYLRRPIE